MKKVWLILSFILIPFLAKAIPVPVGQLVQTTVSIASGQSVGSLISTSGAALVGCQMPSAFTGTSISFSTATSSTGTFQELDNSSGKLSYIVGQGKYIAINPQDFYGIQYLKIISGSTEASARAINCSLKGM